eukprot:PITA_04958
MTLSSLGSFLYYVTFIDDFYHKTWIYFMNTKDKVFSRFQVFKAQVGNLIGNKIKVLRSDNGEVYNSRDFNELCKEARIKGEWIVPYNPQKNGVKNGSPHWILEDNTPEEAFEKVNPKVIHLRIFGFLLYIQIPKEKRKKLYPSGKKDT